MSLVTASIILLTYNQEDFVEEAFLSLLNQDRDDLEIIVSDDCSSDATWEKLQKLTSNYGGQKKIILSRNVVNLGIVDNYMLAISKSSGELIFMAAGDDISLPDRCSKSIEFWCDHHKKYDLVAADAFDMSYDGKKLAIKKNSQLQDWNISKWFEERPYFFGASHMVTRKLLELAPLNNHLPYEDQCLVFRAMMMGGISRLPAPLVCHRRGGMTQTIHFRIGHRKVELIQDMTREINELQQFLSDATLLGKRLEIQEAVNIKLANCQAVLDLFKQKRSLVALMLFWTNSRISLKQKYRYTRYYLFYPIIALAHAVRDSLRLFRS